MKTQWGRLLRVAIVLRRELGREATDAELKQASDSSLPYYNVTKDEVNRAFETGEQVGRRIHLQYYDQADRSVTSNWASAP